VTFYISLAALDGEILASGALATTWLESGLKHDKIYKTLDPKVQDGLETLQFDLDAFFLNLNNKNTYTDVYLLPGNQPIDPGAGTILGNTVDDVTIVLEQSAA
jgi:hypothetical protein